MPVKCALLISKQAGERRSNRSTSSSRPTLGAGEGGRGLRLREVSSVRRYLAHVEGASFECLDEGRGKRLFSWSPCGAPPTLDENVA